MSSTRCGRHGPTATRRYVRPTPWACPRWRCRTSADRSWVDFPRFARVGGRPPYPPECRRTGVVSGSRPSEYQDRTRIASSGRLPLTTYHLPPTTYHLLPRDFRLTELRSGLGLRPRPRGNPPRTTIARLHPRNASRPPAR